MATSADLIHFFGIRHHGPGCARSLLQALEQLQPDCVLVEGPPEGEALLPMLQSAELRPPVAMLVYVQDEPSHAAFYPFAEFSPEWQALQWASRQGVATRFIDLPQTHRMALDMAERAAWLAKLKEEELAEEGAEDEGGEGDGEGGTDGVDSDTAEDADSAAQVSQDAGDATEPAKAAESSAQPEMGPDAGLDKGQDAAQSDIQAELQVSEIANNDPLDWLAQAAGYADGESWWNRMVEERSDSTALFEGIAEAMTAVREQLPNSLRGERYAAREALREAWMRQCLREAVKAGYQRIAVVCGAWHVPALKESVTAKADSTLLKGLPKAKVQATWAPWTYRNLASSSGYGAGVDSPGWYEHLWRYGATPEIEQNFKPNKPIEPENTVQAATENIATDATDAADALSDAEVAEVLAVPPIAKPIQLHGDVVTRRTVGWLARVARLLRSKDLDCSSAHIIETTRLAEGLAALRGHASPGLPELNEAISTVICMGETGPLQLIEHELIVGDVLGSVPADVPQVPLQRDIEQQQKALRMKPEAGAKLLALDLRKDTDLTRSHFLHRLRLLGIDWGTPATDQQRNRGTFRESWQLQWQPELAVRIIEASRFGATLVQAASAKVQQALTADTALPEIAEAIDDALLADLPQLVQALMTQLSERAATTGDVGQLLQSLPALANVYRYGSVRQTDTAMLATVIDSLVLRAAIGLPVACMAMDEDAAAAMRTKVLAAHDALRLRDAAEPKEAWLAALRSLAQGDAAAALLRGMACRLLLDEHLLDNEAVALQFGRNLSLGVVPTDAAAWLDGFLNQQALVLLHDEAIWGAVDAWLAQLGETQFLQILPLVRRSFSNFSNNERQSLGEKAKRAVPGQSTSRAVIIEDGDEPWDSQRAALALPVLSQLLGLQFAPDLNTAADAQLQEVKP